MFSKKLRNHRNLQNRLLYHKDLKISPKKSYLRHWLNSEEIRARNWSSLMHNHRISRAASPCQIPQSRPPKMVILRYHHKEQILSEDHHSTWTNWNTARKYHQLDCRKSLKEPNHQTDTLSLQKLVKELEQMIDLMASLKLLLIRRQLLWVIRVRILKIRRRLSLQVITINPNFILLCWAELTIFKVIIISK